MFINISIFRMKKKTLIRMNAELIKHLTLAFICDSLNKVNSFRLQVIFKVICEVKIFAC